MYTVPRKAWKNSISIYMFLQGGVPSPPWICSCVPGNQVGRNGWVPCMLIFFFFIIIEYFKTFFELRLEPFANKPMFRSVPRPKPYRHFSRVKFCVPRFHFISQIKCYGQLARKRKLKVAWTRKQFVTINLVGFDFLFILHTRWQNTRMPRVRRNILCTHFNRFQETKAHKKKTRQTLYKNP